MPYIVDHDSRTVWIDGRLHINLYFEALEQGLTELRGNVITLHPRPHRDQRAV